jgi:putative NADPH-quinone reductase
MKRMIGIVVCALFVVVMMTGVAFSADKAAAVAEKGAAMQGQEMMITGTINNANQIVDKDGQIFDVADTHEGKELLTYVGLKVQVKGTVLESEGKKQISVTAYEIMK